MVNCLKCDSRIGSSVITVSKVPGPSGSRDLTSVIGVGLFPFNFQPKRIKATGSPTPRLSKLGNARQSST
jgi:hypothetical protein